MYDFEKYGYVNIGIIVGSLIAFWGHSCGEINRQKVAEAEFTSAPALTATYVDENGKVGFDELVNGKYGDGKVDYVAEIAPKTHFTTNELGKTQSGENWQPLLRKNSIKYSR